MFKRFAIILLLLCLNAAAVSAATNDIVTLDSLRRSYELAKARIESDNSGRLQEALKTYAAELDRLEAKMQNAGDLTGLVAVRKQKELLKQEGSIPAETSTNTLSSVQAVISRYYAAIVETTKEKDRKTVALMKRYVEGLKMLEADLVRSGKLDDAVAVRTESTGISFELAEFSPKLPPSLAAEEAKPSKNKTHATVPKKKATIYITCNNHYVVWLNGNEIGRGDRWEQLDKYPVELAEGDIISIEGKDDESGNKSAGLYCCIVLDDENKSWGTDGTWQCAIRKQPFHWEAGKVQGEKKPASAENVASAHRNAVNVYREQNANLQGTFIWSKDPKPVICIQEEISFGKFTAIQR